MSKPISVLLAATLVLTSCGSMRDSRLNPFNWFGRGSAEVVETDGEVNTLIPRRRASVFRKEPDESYKGWEVGEITESLIERRPGGAVLRVTGVADLQGPFEVRLIKVDEESDGETLTYSMRAIQSRGPRGTDLSRTVTAALWLTENELAGISTIRVKSTRNTYIARR